MKQPHLIPANVIRVIQEDSTIKVVKVANLGNEKSATATAQTSTSTHTKRKSGRPSSKKLNEDSSYTVHEDITEIQIFPAADEVVNLNDPAADLSNATQAQKSQPSPKQAQFQVSSCSTTHYQLRTSHGKALKVVLGQTPEVERFDKLHFRLKSKQSNQVTSQEEETYKHSVDAIKQKVLSEKSKANKELAQWEKDCYVRHRMTAPTYDLMKADIQASSLLEIIRNADALLKQWST